MARHRRADRVASSDQLGRLALPHHRSRVPAALAGAGGDDLRPEGRAGVRPADRRVGDPRRIRPVPARAHPLALPPLSGRPAPEPPVALGRCRLGRGNGARLHRIHVPARSVQQLDPGRDPVREPARDRGLHVGRNGDRARDRRGARRRDLDPRRRRPSVPALLGRGTPADARARVRRGDRRDALRPPGAPDRRRGRVRAPGRLGHVRRLGVRPHPRAHRLHGRRRHPRRVPRGDPPVPALGSRRRRQEDRRLRGGRRWDHARRRLGAPRHPRRGVRDGPIGLGARVAARRRGCGAADRPSPATSATHRRPDRLREAGDPVRGPDRVLRAGRRDLLDRGRPAADGETARRRDGSEPGSGARPRRLRARRGDSLARRGRSTRDRAHRNP